MDMAGDPARRAAILVELVGINSVNPLHAGPRSGPGGEGELARWLAKRAGEIGADVVLDEVEPGRPNVYAHFSGGGRRVAIDVHLDTVGVEHMTGDPFTGRMDGGRVYGRGAVDTKATLAVLLPLLDQLGSGDRDASPDLYLIGSVGEEAGGLPGAHRFCQWAAERALRFEQLIVAEPTSCAPVHGHKGGVGLEIRVKGEAAHSSKPELGKNAIVAAARIVAAFQQAHEELAALPPSSAVGPGTLTVTEISGGLARNIIPDECRLFAGRRVVPGEDPDAVFTQLSQLAERAAAPLEIDVAMSNGRCNPAFFEDPHGRLVTELSWLSNEQPTTATYGSNALAYRAIADEIVVFGPGSIDQAHKAVEWIEISELDRAARIYGRWLQLDPATA